jgi:hypothetical protein
MQARKFFLDTQSRSFVGGPSATFPATGRVFFDEDAEAIELYFLEPTGDFSAPYRFLDYSGNSVKLAVGVTAPAALQTSWTSITTAVSASVTELVAGGPGAVEVQQISLSPRAERGNFAIQFPARNITVSSASVSTFICAGPHGLYNGQSVTLTGFTIDNGFDNGDVMFVRDRTNTTFRVATIQGGPAREFDLTSGGGTAELPAQNTAQLPYTATAQEVQDAIVAAGFAINGAPQIIVTGAAGSEYVLSYGGGSAGINFSNVTLVASTLARQPGLTANVNFATTEIAALLAAGASSVTLEVEVSDGTLRQTYQQAATLADDIITSTSPTPLPANTSFLLQSTSHTWSVSIDDDGIMTATKQ